MASLEQLTSLQSQRGDMDQGQPKITSASVSGKSAAGDGESVQQSSPLRSVHTTSFAEILDQGGLSLAVTTYQAGKLVLLRPERRSGSAVVNTHFRDFRRPMGFAWEWGR